MTLKARVTRGPPALPRLAAAARRCSCSASGRGAGWSSGGAAGAAHRPPALRRGRRACGATSGGRAPSGAGYPRRRLSRQPVEEVRVLRRAAPRRRRGSRPGSARENIETRTTPSGFSASARASSRRARARSRSPAPPVTRRARKAGDRRRRGPSSAARLPSMPKTEWRTTPKPAARGRGQERVGLARGRRRRLHHAEGGAGGDRGAAGRGVARHRHRPGLAGGADVLEGADDLVGQRRGGDAVEGVEVEVVGAEAAQALLEGAGEERRRQRQRLGRLGAAAAEDAARGRARPATAARASGISAALRPPGRTPGRGRPCCRAGRCRGGGPARKRPAISSARPAP